MELNNLLDTIDGLMRSGNYSDAMLRWLQSGDRTEEIFQQVLSNYNPMFAQDLPPLVLLSVGATVSRELSRGAPKLTKKISLLEIILYSFNQHIGNLVSSRFYPFVNTSIANFCAGRPSSRCHAQDHAGPQVAYRATPPRHQPYCAARSVHQDPFWPEPARQPHCRERAKRAGPPCFDARPCRPYGRVLDLMS